MTCHLCGIAPSATATGAATLWMVVELPTEKRQFCRKCWKATERKEDG